jgi:hypothetical protein
MGKFYRIRTTTIVGGSHRSAVLPEPLHEGIVNKWMSVHKIIYKSKNYTITETLNGFEAVRGIETLKIEKEPAA